MVDANRAFFEAWMAGHCWSLEEGWDPVQGDYRCLTPRTLWAAWRDAGRFFDLDREMGQGQVHSRTGLHSNSDELDLARRVGAGQLMAPSDPDHRAAFEAWVLDQALRQPGPYAGLKQATWDRDKQCYKLMAHRILWAAWRERLLFEQLRQQALLSAHERLSSPN